MKNQAFTVIGKVFTVFLAAYVLVWLVTAVGGANSKGYGDTLTLKEYDDHFVVCRVVKRSSALWPTIIFVYDKPVEFCQEVTP